MLSLGAWRMGLGALTDLYIVAAVDSFGAFFDLFAQAHIALCDGFNIILKFAGPLGPKRVR